jgi:tetratricopeptide (TPR) repeat protein
MVVVLFSIAGFYYMYLLRRIIWNPLFARSQKIIDRLQISGNVSAVATDVENAVPQSLLLGRESIGEAIEANGPQAKALEERLFGSTVLTFLKNCESDLTGGVPISNEVVDRAATLYYYQSYFKKDDRDVRIDNAIAWVSRSLTRDPLNISFSVKLADLFGMQERYAETASILERFVGDPDAPQYIRQWLGYYLLYIDGREQRAVDYSLEYFRLFPTQASAPFNASCGYAQLYLIELQGLGVSAVPDSENRRKSLEFLEQAIRMDPTSREWARKYAVVDESFESLISDEKFLEITTPYEGRISASKPGPTKVAKNLKQT